MWFKWDRITWEIIFTLFGSTFYRRIWVWSLIKISTGPLIGIKEATASARHDSKKNRQLGIDCCLFPSSHSFLLITIKKVLVPYIVSRIEISVQVKYIDIQIFWGKYNYHKIKKGYSLLFSLCEFWNIISYFISQQILNLQDKRDTNFCITKQCCKYLVFLGS